MGSRHGKRESLRSLAEAFDQGVNYFDVAPAYGYGEAEGILGTFVRDKRDRVIIATKFGIEPPRVTPTRRLFKAVARRVFHVVPALRTVARRPLGAQFTRKQFNVEQAARSLEQSLQQLKTDHVDVFLIHDCTREALGDARLLDFLDGLVTTGKALCIGVSGERTIVEEAVRLRPGSMTVAQFRHDIFQPPVSDAFRNARHLAVVGYHPFGGERGVARVRALIRSVRDDPHEPSELRRKLRDISEEDAISAVALAEARHGEGLTVVLAAMFTSRHIRANARTVEAQLFDTDDLARFRAKARNLADSTLGGHA